MNRLLTGLLLLAVVLLVLDGVAAADVAATVALLAAVAVEVRR